MCLYMQVAQWSASKSYLSNSFVCSPPNSWIQTTQGIQRPVHQIATLHLRQLLDCASEGMPLNNFELPLRNSAVSCDGSKSGYLRGNLLAYCMQSQGPVLEHVKATACMQHMLPWSLTGSNMHATLHSVLRSWIHLRTLYQPTISTCIWQIPMGRACSGLLL